jgi:transposase
MDIAVLGIDLGKNSCSMVGLDGSGKVILRRRMQRKTIMAVAAKLSPCIIAMEACCGAHHLGRVLAAQGHTIRLMSPEYVRPYVKAQKNDDRDAEAIAEAATRPTMRFVTLKSEEQLDMQTLHRIRDRAVGERTSLMNQLRAVLLERGVIVPQGRANQDLSHQGRVGVEVFTRTDLLAAAIPCPIDDLQRKAVGQRHLLAPAKLARHHAAMQQHRSRAMANTLDEQTVHDRNPMPLAARRRNGTVEKFLGQAHQLSFFVLDVETPHVVLLQRDGNTAHQIARHQPRCASMCCTGSKVACRA